MDFSHYDVRKYPTVSVREGYGEWVRTYEDTVLDVMDIRLLEKIQSVEWRSVERAVDLACGTGRTGAWLTQKGVQHIDGLDLTIEMLRVAQSKRVHERLVNADIANTGLQPATYDLAVQSLADEHIRDIAPVYREVARITRPGAQFVMVGYHPFFLMSGIPTHYDRTSGGPATIESYVHLLSDHVKAARDAGWQLVEMDESLIDAEWVKRKPKWAKYLGRPISFSIVWRKSA